MSSRKQLAFGDLGTAATKISSYNARSEETATRKLTNVRMALAFPTCATKATHEYLQDLCRLHFFMRNIIKQPVSSVTTYSGSNFRAVRGCSGASSRMVVPLTDLTSSLPPSSCARRFMLSKPLPPFCPGCGAVSAKPRPLSHTRSDR